MSARKPYKYEKKAVVASRKNEQNFVIVLYDVCVSTGYFYLFYQPVLHICYNREV